VTRRRPREVLDWAKVEDLAAVAAFYRTVGYGLEIDPDDRILTTKIENKIVAAVRLCNEENLLVLRGMYVSANQRRRGIGTKLLDSISAAIGSGECWCVPYTHLRDFYARSGFSECDPRFAPDFLRVRSAAYRKAGHKVIIMKRGSHGPERV
jgi:N-acetylglutamate synthase-like GNAT family acetyltransferase